jgi:alkylhydroperoxidase family enzyme
MRLSDYKPSSLLVKIAFFFSKQRFGKVIAPLRRIYSRRPALLGVVMKIEAVNKKLSLPQELKLLLRTYVSSLNECSFCSDLNLYESQKGRIAREKLKDLLNFRTNNSFSEKEKAMLAYCEEVTLSKTCTDECFIELKKHFTEEEIIEITWLNAVENYFNYQAKPLGLSSDGLYRVPVK